MTAIPTAPPQRPTKPPAAKCPRCAGLLLRQNVYDPEGGAEAVLTCANCGYELPADQLPATTFPNTNQTPELPAEPAMTDTEPKTIPKRIFQRKDEAGHWPPEARQFVDQVVADNPQLSPKAVAKFIIDNTNIPKYTVISRLNRRRNTLRERAATAKPTDQSPRNGAASEQPTLEPAVPEPSRPNPAPPDNPRREDPPEPAAPAPQP